jgi:hypothetical protein
MKLSALLALACWLSACSLGEGEGEISSDKLIVPGCWNDKFQLTPDFFAAVPYRRSLTIRVQHGGDTEEVSDGAIILVDDVDKIRGQISAQGGSAAFRVAQPPSIVPPGFPIVADPNPALVHLTLYLHRACHAQNSALYSIDGTMTFHSLFNADPNETDAAEKLTDAEFSDISLADPRDLVMGGGAAQDGGGAAQDGGGAALDGGGAALDGGGAALDGGAAAPGGASAGQNVSHIRGRFKFYFQRGQPAQPFP